MSGCTGACCAAFPLSVDLEYLWLHHGHIRDGTLIASMLIPLEPAVARARAAAAGSTITVSDDTEWFTCRHWNPETRLCGIYEGRPAMCRAYPGAGRVHGTACDHGCPHVETSPAP